MSIHKLIYTIALAVLVIGGINWGLVGLFNYDLVADLFGPLSIVSRTIYSLVGISALYVAIDSWFIMHHHDWTSHDHTPLHTHTR